MQKHRTLYIFATILLFIALSSFLVAGHSGGTDSNGGHYDSSTGEYHYHHGYSAHQHPNGRCPYLYDDNTENHSISNKKQTEHSIPYLIFGGILCGLFASFAILFVFGIGFIIPKKARLPAVVVICIITTIIAFCVYG